MRMKIFKNIHRWKREKGIFVDSCVCVGNVLLTGVTLQMFFEEVQLNSGKIYSEPNCVIYSMLFKDVELKKEKN